MLKYVNTGVVFQEIPDETQQMSRLSQPLSMGKHWYGA